MAIRLIVGLGNPGVKYIGTRHNAGFAWVDEIARREKLALHLEHKFHGLTGKAVLAGKPVWLLEPQTYMNMSGRAVRALASFYHIAAEETLVVHDELDLPPGVVKLKYGGGSGGHNGVKDIATHFNTPDFWRLRLGVGHPGAQAQVADFVLHAPSRVEAEQIEVASQQALEILPDMVDGQFEQAMRRLHTMNRP